MTPETERLRAALELIAADRTPCMTCLRVHELRRMNNQISQTWADPEDEHIYRRAGAQEWAQWVLDGHAVPQFPEDARRVPDRDEGV